MARVLQCWPGGQNIRSLLCDVFRADTGYADSAGVSNSGTGNDLQLPLTLEATQTLTNHSDQIVSGGVDLAGFNVMFDGTGMTQVPSAVTWSGNLIKRGGGTLVLESANSYSGTTTVTAGTLRLLHAQALGSGDGTAATETILTGGAISVGTEIAVASGERLHGSGPCEVSLTGEGVGASWGGDVLLEATALYLRGTLAIQGTITETGAGTDYLYANGNVTLNGVANVGVLQNQFSSLFVNADATATSAFRNSGTTTISDATLPTPYLEGYGALVLSHGTLSYASSTFYAAVSLSGVGTIQNSGTLPASNVSPGLSAEIAGVLNTNSLSLGGIHGRSERQHARRRDRSLRPNPSDRNGPSRWIVASDLKRRLLAHHECQIHAHCQRR